MNTSQNQRFTVIPAVYLVLANQGKILFGKRQHTGYRDGFWQLPSGHLEGGENLKQGLIREAQEEVNLKLTEEDLSLVFVAHRFVEKGIERVDFYFLAKQFDLSQIHNNEPDKCSDLDWLDLTNPDIIPEVREVLKSYQQGQNYLTFGF